MLAQRVVPSMALLLIGICSTLVAAAQPGAEPVQRPGTEAPAEARGAISSVELPRVELAALVERVAAAARKRFLIDVRAAPNVYLGTLREADVDYRALLGILRSNGLAAVEIDGIVNIVPVSDIRSYPLPIVDRDDDSLAGDEWVTRVVSVTNVDAAELVPLLRPLVAMPGHLAAHPPGRLIVVDRYANVQRITALVRALDR